MSYILVIHNPISGNGNNVLVDRVIEGLKILGHDVDYYATQSAGDATRYLQQMTTELDIVVAAGGDGTVNEVVNGLINRPNNSYRLAVIPIGTTNVLAKELGIGRSASKIVRMFRNELTKEIYPARANGRRFLLMAGVGYDAWVVDNVDLALKKRIGKFAYILSMIKQLKWFGSKNYQVTVDGKVYQANSVVITNGRLYGGSFTISRHADLSSAKTQVLMMSSRSPLRFLMTLLGLPVGQLERMPGIVSVAAKHIVVENIGNETTVSSEPVQADGDSVTHLPLNVVMEENPIQILIP
ncbi:MAG: diacylglycerol kinase family lipid kinase [Oleibacter sp.]|nr:diacylglycerol kinase family lipid kinase [Thalassolituus sp.]